MRAAGGGEGIVYGSSSYPWMNSSMQYDDYCRYYSGGSAADPWGYCKRQCVSYVAWKLNTDGRGNRGYSGLGNASNWGYGGYGVSMGSVQPGDVIVWYIGYYGHVMYVEWADGGQVGISQMNVPYDSGAYSTKTYSMSELQSGAYEARRFH
jgi:surface antigen